MTTLAWRAFVDPMFLHDTWYWLLIPMAFGMSVAYRAVRMPSLAAWGPYWKAVVVMTTQIILGMIGLAVALFLLVQVYPKLLPT